MSAPRPLPERLTIATCIGCGAMSLPAACAGGCGAERKLELIDGAVLDELIEAERRAARRARALSDVLTRFVTLPPGELRAELRGLARATLRAHEREWPAATGTAAVEPEPVVSWWCEQCGGLDAPAPCIGVCIRRRAQWASLDALRLQREATRARLHDERQLAAAVRALLHTRPRPGGELRHWQALRELAVRALDPPNSATAGDVAGCH